MTADGTPGPRNGPRFLDGGAPDLANDSNILSSFTELVGNRYVGTKATREALQGKAVWEGVEFEETDTGATWKYRSGTWVIALRARTAWTNLALQDSWANQGNFPPLRARLDEVGNVHIQGQVLPKANYTLGVVFATLPAGMRPSIKLESPVVGNNSATRIAGGCLIDVNGNMSLTQANFGAFSLGNTVISTV